MSFFNLFKTREIEEYKIGQTINFGRYPQTNEQKVDSIEWIILDICNNIVLLISKLCIITSGYCDIKNAEDDIRYLEWEHSLAREMCNEHFYNIAFNREEKQTIYTKHVEMPEYAKHYDDHVFLLSEKEIAKYLPDSTDRLAYPTQCAKAKGARVGWGGYEKCSAWWLMPQYEPIGKTISMSGKEYSGMIYPKAVFPNGEIQYHSRNVYHSDFTIRPCIQIDLNKYKKLGQRCSRRVHRATMSRIGE